MRCLYCCTCNLSFWALNHIDPGVSCGHLGTMQRLGSRSIKEQRLNSSHGIPQPFAQVVFAMGRQAEMTFHRSTPLCCIRSAPMCWQTCMVHLCRLHQHVAAKKVVEVPNDRAGKSLRAASGRPTLDQVDFLCSAGEVSTIKFPGIACARSWRIW